MLAPGTPAPSFTLTDSTGTEVSLSDYAGKWVLFWWYPEANSSGCSIQAASIERSLEAFSAADVAVLGASFNTVKQNDDFACDKELNYPLLSDPEMVAGTAYEVVRAPDDRFPTKPYRYTYLIDPEGTIVFAENADEQQPFGTYGEHVLEAVSAAQTS